MAQRDAALRAPQAQAPSPLDESAVAEFLLSRKYMLTALELHQELLEGNNGIHNVPSLNAFFNSPEKYAMLVRATESRAKDNAGAGKFAQWAKGRAAAQATCCCRAAEAGCCRGAAQAGSSWCARQQDSLVTDGTKTKRGGSEGLPCERGGP